VRTAQEARRIAQKALSPGPSLIQTVRPQKSDIRLKLKIIGKGPTEKGMRSLKGLLRSPL
jgi:hypothetical protein